MVVEVALTEQSGSEKPLVGSSDVTIGADITLENYTCLCTLYKDGSVGIPMHSDSEPGSIMEDSQIYTVSIGATRNLRISNTVGPYNLTSNA